MVKSDPDSYREEIVNRKKIDNKINNTNSNH